MEWTCKKAMLIRKWASIMGGQIADGDLFCIFLLHWMAAATQFWQPARQALMQCHAMRAILSILFSELHCSLEGYRMIKQSSIVQCSASSRLLHATECLLCFEFARTFTLSHLSGTLYNSDKPCHFYIWLWFLCSFAHSKCYTVHTWYWEEMSNTVRSCIDFAMYLWYLGG